MYNNQFVYRNQGISINHVHPKPQRKASDLLPDGPFRSPIGQGGFNAYTCTNKTPWKKGNDIVSANNSIIVILRKIYFCILKIFLYFYLF